MTRRSRFWRCPVCGRRMVPEVADGASVAKISSEKGGE